MTLLIVHEEDRLDDPVVFVDVVGRSFGGLPDYNSTFEAVFRAVHHPEVHGCEGSAAFIADALVGYRRSYWVDERYCFSIKEI